LAPGDGWLWFGERERSTRDDNAAPSVSRSIPPLLAIVYTSIAKINKIMMIFHRPLFLVLCAAICGGTASAFTPSSSTTTPLSSHRGPASASKTSLFGGGQGIATSLEGKIKTVEIVKGLLETSEMIFTVPASSLTVKQARQLRLKFPEGTIAKVVKNSLMKRALEGTAYEEPTGHLLTGSNMWVFIQSDIGSSIKSYQEFIKENRKEDTHSIIGGVLEGQSFDTAGIIKIGQLPTKDQLYAQIAGSIKAVPTKVARVIKAPSSKLARAIKLATDEIHGLNKKDDEEKPAEP
jgi:large subunit ribosomal protein L10